MEKTKLREVVKCRDCMDEKICHLCQGVGSWSGFDILSGERWNDECKACCGSGKCPWCPEDEEE